MKLNQGKYRKTDDSASPLQRDDLTDRPAGLKITAASRWEGNELVLATPRQNGECLGRQRTGRSEKPERRSAA